MNRLYPRLFGPILVCLTIIFSCLSAFPAEPPINLALGKPYTLEPAPNYGLCTDPDDKIQLTDGKYVEGYFWGQKGTVGWAGPRLVTITIDLGKIEPIGGVSFNTAGGVAGVEWPEAIYILSSDDGQNFFYGGNLVLLHEGQLPDPKGYQIFRYKTNSLKAKGRYVRFLVVPKGETQWFVFSDEIEVYRGDDSFLTLENTSEPFTSANVATKLGCEKRFRADLGKIRELIDQSQLEANRKDKALEEIAALTKEIASFNFPKEAAAFKTIVPFNDVHRRIFALNAQVLSSQGYPPLFVWHKDRYAPLSLFEKPGKESSGLDVVMMKNETRAEVFNLTNTTSAEMNLRFQVQGLPAGTNPSYVQPYQVESVDTFSGTVVAAPLIEMKQENGYYQTTVPSGMTRQIWLSFHPQKVLSGNYQGRIVLQTGKFQKTLSLAFHLAQLTFPDVPDFDFSMWDYTEPPACYGITPQNRSLAIADLQAHYVSVPCSPGGARPVVDDSNFDQEGNLIKPPDFTRFDGWVKEWPKARRYYVFTNVGDSFGRFNRGTPAFSQAVAQWAKSWAEHAKNIGLKAGQVLFHPVDEPNTTEDYQRFLDWARSFKKGTQEIPCFINPPGGNQPWEVAGEEAVRFADVISPALCQEYRGGEKARKFYKDLVDQGKTFWFYGMSMSGIYDPTVCQRLAPWHSFIHGGVGFGFWSYCDEPATGTCWNEYPRQGTDFCPVFLEKDKITATKYWEAAREGIEDYQYFKMLRDRIQEMLKRDSTNALALAARNFLESLEKDVMMKVVTEKELTIEPAYWTKERNYTIIESTRFKALQYLVKLK